MRRCRSRSDARYRVADRLQLVLAFQRPPLTSTTVPVTKLAGPDSSHTIASATLSGAPTPAERGVVHDRRIAFAAARGLVDLGVDQLRRHGVDRMPSGPTSRARPNVKVSSAALDAA